jgi:Zinc finger C-x8-C-x5-C-x3-H type (and similar)
MSGDKDFMETEDVSKSTEKTTASSDKLSALAVPEKPGERDAAEEVKKKSGSPETVPLSPASQSSGNVTPTAFNQRPCAFFAKGICRHGNSCRFSHSPSAFREDSSGNTGAVSSSGAGGPNPIPMSRPAPPPVVVNIPPGHPVYSIDVECVATGVQHNARSLAQVALVDEWSRPVFNVLIKQDLPVVSYITELTGLTKELLDAHGMPLGA